MPRNVIGNPETNSKQELEEDIIEDLERTCNECRRPGQVCLWPRKNRQKACWPLSAKHIKCMWDGELVTQHAP